MKKFDEFISDDIINWLLEDDNPSVKYYTLVDLLGKTFDDEEVTTAKEQIMKTGAGPKDFIKTGAWWLLGHTE